MQKKKGFMWQHMYRTLKILSFLLLFLCITSSPAMPESAPAETPILKLDTGGHMAIIRKIAAMGDGRRIISASNDKTIRIWDTETGQETAKILGQIGGGPEGMISAIALIPDKGIRGHAPDKLAPESSNQGSIRGQAPDRLVPADSMQGWLAVGGILAGESRDDMTAIRIYDLKTGALIKALKSHEDAVLDLAVSKDGRYLVSGSADTTVKVWDIANDFSLVHTFEGHTKAVYAVMIFRDGGDDNPLTPFDKGDLRKSTIDKGNYKIVSAGDDNKAILWSLNDKKMVSSYTHSDKLDSIAVSESYIAVSGNGNKINIFDHNLKRIKEIKSKTEHTGLSFSPDGRLLLAGFSFDYREDSDVCNIYDSQRGFKEITSFNKHDNLTMAVTFLNNRTAVTGGGANNDIYIWDAYTGEVKRHISGNGKCVWSVGIRGLSSNASNGGREIAFGNTFGPKSVIDRGRLEKSINLESYTVNNPLNPPLLRGTKLTQAEEFKRVNTVYQGYSLTHTAGGDYGYEAAVLLIKKDGKETGRIKRGETDGYRHNTYGFTGDGAIISGGLNGFLTAYNKEGQKTASFIGHTGEVWGIATDGDTLVSGGDDQTIKLWNLKELKNLNPPSIDYEWLKKTVTIWEKLTGKKWTIEDIKKELDSRGISSVYMKVPEIKPIASIFISDDGNWVVWTEEGFYNASTKGDQYVGWHVNKGPDHRAEYYNARQFRKYLYRPDVIKNAMDKGSSSLAVKEAGLEDVTVSELIKRAPVDVKIDSVNVAKDGKAEVSVRLGKNTTTAPERITLYVNGAQALTEAQRVLKGAAPGDILKYHVNLTDSKNHIRVTVENEWAENSHETTVDCSGGNDTVSTKNTTLYVVAVGISHYPGLPSQQQLNSPLLDAKSIAARFQKLEGKLYKKVDVKILTDDKQTVITSGMVEQALREQTQKAGALDTTIIFLAGHGVTDGQGSYHFVTGDTKLTNAFGEQLNLREGTSLDWKRLHNILDTAMGRRMVIVDTCQAGEVFSDNKTDIKRLVKDIHDVNAIVYSGTSRQDFATGSAEGGVFTLSIINGIDGKASYEGNILPFTQLKNYVDQEVPRLNREIMLCMHKRALSVIGKQKGEAAVDLDSVQKPVAVIPDGMERFVIYSK